MRLFYTTLFCLIVSFASIAALSGTYIIKDDGTGDYLTLQAAINDAEATGLSGATTFEIHNPLTNLTVINAIPNASAQRKLTITALPNYLVQSLICDNASWLVLEDIGFLETLSIKSSKRIVVRECTFWGANGITSSNTGQSKFLTITDNDFLNISNSTTGAAIYISNALNGQTRNVVVKNNYITGAYNSGIDFHNGVRDITVSDNVITVESNFAFLLDIGECEGLVNIRRNQLISLPDDPSNNSYGMVITGSDDTKIANNFISTSGPGLYISGASNQFIANNSIRSLHGNGVNIYSDNVTFKNNAIYSHNQCLYYDAANLNSDYNAYHSDDANEFTYLGAFYSALSTLQATHNTDHNSMLADPQFLSDTDLHLSSTSSLINNGISLAQVTKDIDEGARGIQVDIGADEYGVSKSAAIEETPFIGIPSLSVHAYPNPSDGQFRVDGEFSAESNYQLMDIQGREISKAPLGKGAINLKGISTGSYVLQIIDGNRIGTTVIVIE